MLDEVVPILCNLHALPNLERYKSLSNRLREAMTGRAELPDGFAYSIDRALMPVGELGEWIELECQCCPFLSFEFSLSASGGPCWLTLSGPEGVKEILDREFPA